MEPSTKRGLAVLIVLGISIFGYSQYASASQIAVDVTKSELLGKTDTGSQYDVELRFQNPSLLVLTAGTTEFFVMADDQMIGKGQLDPFILGPLEDSHVAGTFHTSGDADESQQVKITGITKYDVLVTSIDVPFVYYPTDEQASEFIHQG